MAGLGAGVMASWLLDPRYGRRRRAFLKDKAVRSVHEVQDVVTKGVRDLGHRAKGRVSETRGRLRREHPDAMILHERVRAELGRWVSHPHAISVEILDGGVILSGPILAEEVEPLVSAVTCVRGVAMVENRLFPHATPEGIPALQGGQLRPGRRSPLRQDPVPPASRLLGWLGGTLLLAGGVRALERLLRG